MRAISGSTPRKKDKAGQKVTGKKAKVRKAAASLGDRDVTVSTRRKRRKTGGYKPLKGLRWSEVQQVFEVAKLAKEARLPLNMFCTIRLPEAYEGDVRSAKRYLCNKAKYIIQTVRGRNATRFRQQKIPAVTVYEKRLNGPLHCHLIGHRARGNDAVLKIADGVLIDIRPANDRHVGYITKARLPLSKEFEATCGHRRQGGQDAIKGARLSLNGDAKALLSASKKRALVALPVPAMAYPPIGLGEQGWLFMPEAIPQIDVLAQAEEKRIRLGLTQDNVAGFFGCTQSHWSHSVVRRHDRLGWFVLGQVRRWIAAA